MRACVCVANVIHEQARRYIAHARLQYAAVYPCAYQDFTAPGAKLPKGVKPLLKPESCEGYAGPDAWRVGFCVFGVVWALAGELGVVRGHPISWACRTVREWVVDPLVVHGKLGPKVAGWGG